MRTFAIAIFACAVAVAQCDVFAGQMPGPDERAKMSRFVINNANWTSFGYVSRICDDPKGCPANAVFATSDGPVGCGAGIPYFWASRHHPSVVELLDNDSRGALAFTLAQTEICQEKGWDPQDPRCAHIIIYGKFVPLKENTEEWKTGKAALLLRHPQFDYYPPAHKFFYAKLDITKIEIISKFGGPVIVDLKEYFSIKC